MALTITPHTFTVYRASLGSSGDFVGMPSFTLVLAGTGLIDAVSQDEAFRTWGVEVTDASELVTHYGLDIRVDDRVHHGTNKYRVLGVRKHATGGPCDHLHLLLEKLTNA